jgi:ADP-dependent NAD(P)H-hydrate dehydratase / NAD(P)H-hydrate epimerase
MMTKNKDSKIKQTMADSNFLTVGMVKSALPSRNIDAHKGSFGSVAILGGDTGMVGAVLLAARAALHSGAGRIYAAMLCKNAPKVDMLQPEIMLRPTAEIAKLPQLDCAVLGPGLGQSEAASALLEFWLAQNIPLLLDADALNLISKHPRLASLVKERVSATVITPHLGEAARLLGVNVAHIQQNRTESALQLARYFHAVCVLKGAGTICAHFDGHLFTNTSGNVGLASGGTGDVLSGIVGSLIAQGLSALDAAKLGVYVHGAAADALLKKGIGPIGMTASEVALEARYVLNALNSNN